MVEPDVDLQRETPQASRAAPRSPAALRLPPRLDVDLQRETPGIAGRAVVTGRAPAVAQVGQLAEQMGIGEDATRQIIAAVDAAKVEIIAQVAFRVRRMDVALLV